MTMIDIEKFICSLIERSSGLTQQIFHSDLLNALKEQGLEYKNGEIVKTQRRVAAEAKEAIFDNEDERMKREAISIIQSYMNIRDEAQDPCYTGEKVIAWLEKQSEQKPTLGEEDERMYKIALSCIETLEDISDGKNMHADVKDWLTKVRRKVI